MGLQTTEERLRREHDLPSNFFFWRWKCFPERGDPIYVEFVGGRCPLISRGKRKGKPNYAKATGQQTFNVTIEQSDQWELDYETETGNCRECRGSGKEVARISFVGNGHTEHRTCHMCGGTGKAVR